MTAENRALVEYRVQAVIPQDLYLALAKALQEEVARGAASEETLKSYLYNVLEYSRWCEACGISPGQATKAEVKAYRRYLEEKGRTPGTIAVKLSVLRRLFEAARNAGLRGDNPAAGVHGPRQATEAWEKREALSEEEVQALLRSPDTTTARGIRDLAMLALLYYQGLRLSEVRGLSLKDYIRSGDPRLKVLGKGRKERKAYLVPEVQEVLERYLAVRGPGDPGDPLFLALGNRSGGTRLTTRSVHRIVRGYLESVGIDREGVTPHSLRHSYATHSLQRGAGLLAVSRALGHSSVTTTETYVKMIFRAEENPSRYLQPLFVGES